MKIKGDHFFNGLWHQGKGERFTTLNPATQEVLADFHHADGTEVNAAVRSAKEAFHMWSRMTLDARIFVLNKFVLALHDAKEQLSETISRETGKPLWEAESEVRAMLNKIPITIEAYQDRCVNLKINQVSDSQKTIFKPHGVVAVIGPFNLPGHLAHGHIVPALLAGNTCVYKPSEQTPLVGYLYARLWEETGLPQGVFQLIQGGKETGMALSMNDDLKGLYFTGSATAGRAIHHLFGGHPERILALEMGGNNPLVVGQVNDLRAAAYIIAQSAFLTSGQRCTCARRLIMIENESTDALLEKLVKVCGSIQVGPYDGVPEPFMGPVISLEAAENINRFYHDILYSGGKDLLPMKAGDPPNMLSPGIVDVTGVQ
ncbi:MAG: aldehyde dehydrogenase family protein, partial [Candidatus Omnitrophica bacterium]|nr:aldehyde dehydrogenase family protein [Candidatus Omnitrophota bacterium]